MGSSSVKLTGRPPARYLRVMTSEETRPWGSFRVLDDGPGFKVKRITVNPGGKLSLQSHDHRSEHWVVVQGTARVTVGGDRRDFGPNSAVYIDTGQQHRLENPAAEMLELIEVQYGDYLGEDDIIRYEDAYNRS